MVRKVRAKMQRGGFICIPTPKEIKTKEEVMGVGTETCLEHLAPPADRIPLFVAGSIKDRFKSRDHQTRFFFLPETSHPNRPLAFANASSPDKSNSLESADPHVTFHQGFV